jgi:hypothetical protein
MVEREVQPEPTNGELEPGKGIDRGDIWSSQRADVADDPAGVAVVERHTTPP